MNLKFAIFRNLIFNSKFNKVFNLINLIFLGRRFFIKYSQIMRGPELTITFFE